MCHPKLFHMYQMPYQNLYYSTVHSYYSCINEDANNNCYEKMLKFSCNFQIFKRFYKKKKNSMSKQDSVWHLFLLRKHIHCRKWDFYISIIFYKWKERFQDLVIQCISFVSLNILSLSFLQVVSPPFPKSQMPLKKTFNNVHSHGQ